MTGLPEFDFPPLEPLFYKFGTVVYDAGLIHAKMNISNFNGDGLSKTLFLAARSHFVDEIFQLEIDTQIPKFSGSGEVEAIGSVGPFSLNGNGKSTHFFIEKSHLYCYYIIILHLYRYHNLWQGPST